MISFTPQGFLLQHKGAVLLAILALAVASYVGVLHWRLHDAEADLAIADATIARLNAIGHEQAAHATAVNLESAGITQRATDALVSQLADAHARADADARRLQELAAAYRGGSVSLVPDAAAVPAGPGPAAPGAAEAISAVTEYTRACEDDSARLTAWQDWYRAQRAAFGAVGPPP